QSNTVRILSSNPLSIGHEFKRSSELHQNKMNTCILLFLLSICVLTLCNPCPPGKTGPQCEYHLCTQNIISKTWSNSEFSAPLSATSWTSFSGKVKNTNHVN